MRGRSGNGTSGPDSAAPPFDAAQGGLREGEGDVVGATGRSPLLAEGPPLADDVPEPGRHDPKTDGGCAVAFGYDVDMPGPDLAYLYDRRIAWPRECHGHLNEDVADYIRKLAAVAERHEVRLQFFLQGNTLEDPADLWVEMVARGHAVDGHSYSHISLIDAPLDEVERQVAETKKLIEGKLDTVSVGLRGPGGYPKGLDGREDVQEVLLGVGIKWITSQYPYGLLPDHRRAALRQAQDRPHGAAGHPERRRRAGTEESTIQDIAHLQPYFYPTRLLEIPFCCYQDRSFFDPDMGGDPDRPAADWTAYLKRAVEFADDHHLFLSLTVHPSTSFKHDPEAAYLNEVLSYCRGRPGVRVVTYRGIYRCVATE